MRRARSSEDQLPSADAEMEDRDDADEADEEGETTAPLLSGGLAARVESDGRGKNEEDTGKGEMRMGEGVLSLLKVGREENSSCMKWESSLWLGEEEERKEEVGVECEDDSSRRLERSAESRTLFSTSSSSSSLSRSISSILASSSSSRACSASVQSPTSSGSRI